MFSSKIKKYLDRLSVSSKKPHSYLFIGPDGVGKEDAVYYFVQRITGKDSDENFLPKIKSRNHPDVIVVEPEREEKEGRIREKEITIFQIREARERLKFFPYELKSKFCIIKRAHRMNHEASNSLLKILEEPRPNTYLILLSYGVEAVFPTIASRCAVLRFPLLSSKELKSWAEGYKIEKAKLEEIKLWSGGRIKVAEELIGDKDFLRKKKERRIELRKIFTSEIYERFDWVEKKSKNKSELVETLQDWENLVAQSLRRTLRKESDNRLKIGKIVFLLNGVREVIDKIEGSNANPRTVMESLVLDMEWR